MAAVPSLPQELLDLIIDALYTASGTAPLKTLSTVSRAWRPRSQSNIFRKLLLDCAMMRRIHSETTEPTSATEATGNLPRQRLPVVFAYVRKLHIIALQVTSPENDGEYLEILRFLTNVTSLRILDWDFREFDTHHITNFLGHFGVTVRNLKLHESYVNSEVLIFLTSLFPHVDNLEVDPRYPCRAITYKVQSSDLPSRSVGFRGDLIFRFLGAQHEGFLAFVNENCSDVRSISAELCVNKGELQRLFERQGDKLSAVGIHSLWKQDLISLSSCTGIRTLSIHLLGDLKRDDPNWEALLTVNSPYLEEIQICSFDGMVTDTSPMGWEEIDDLLCQHHDKSRRSGAEGLLVSLHPTDIDSESECARLMEFVRRAWPRFVKKGTLALNLEP